MTDTEAKALFEVRQNLANAAITGGMKNVRPSVDAALDMLDTLTDLVIAAAQTEALHAAEMRELKERFSEVLGRIKAGCIPAPYRPKFEMFAAPFILPAPDPLVEVLTDMECPDAASIGRELRAAMQARGYEWRKIGEAGE